MPDLDLTGRQCPISRSAAKLDEGHDVAIVGDHVMHVDIGIPGRRDPPHLLQEGAPVGDQTVTSWFTPDDVLTQERRNRIHVASQQPRDTRCWSGEGSTQGMAPGCREGVTRAAAR